MFRQKIMVNGTIKECHNFSNFAPSKKLAMEENKYIRPSWDEYFMEIADTVSKRATCDRGRSGCVIVRDRQILVTGYVGSPKGLPHCDEVGHQLKQTVHEDGTVTGQDISGVWTPESGTYYMSVTVGGTSFSGAFCAMQDDAGTDCMTFSAVGDNRSLWGVSYPSAE